MHGFHRSRVRIFFEVLCAFTISASCVGAWIQTYAWALLPAAFVAGLYGLVHAFDMAGRRSTGAADPQAIDSATDQQYDFLADPDAGVPLAAEKLTTQSAVQEVAAEQELTTENAVQEVAADQEPTTENAIEEVAADQEPTTENAIEEAQSLEPTAPQASGGRRAKAPRKGGGRRTSAPKAAKVTELARHVEAELAVPATDVEAAPIPVIPLFEPEPFVRQQRAVFGRKAG